MNADDRLRPRPLRRPDEAELRRIVSPDARIEKLAGGFGFIEGPVWSSAGGGSLIFSDIPGNELKRWTPGGGPARERRERRHLPCPQPQRQRQHPRPGGAPDHLRAQRAPGQHREPDGRVDTLVDAYQGKRLNSPNDVVVKSDGSVWFTDPPYGLRERPEDQEQEHNHVFRFDPRSGDAALRRRRLPPPQRALLLPGRAPASTSPTPATRTTSASSTSGEDGALTGGQRLLHRHPGHPGRHALRHRQGASTPAPGTASTSSPRRRPDRQDHHPGRPGALRPLPDRPRGPGQPLLRRPGRRRPSTSPPAPPSTPSPSSPAAPSCTEAPGRPRARRLRAGIRRRRRSRPRAGGCAAPSPGAGSAGPPPDRPPPRSRAGRGRAGSPPRAPGAP